MKIMVLVAAYNEEKTIVNVIEEIKTHVQNADICVVNDGSTDKTADILSSRQDIRSLHLPFNMGIGGAVWTGFNFMYREGYDYLIRIDGDGQHDPKQAMSLLVPLIGGDADIVIGSRFLKKQGYLSTFSRRGGIKLLDILSRFILKQKIVDNTSGFRAYNRAVISKFIKEYPFDYPEPIETYIAAKKGFRIKEIPAVMRKRKGGISSIRIVHSYYYLVKVLLTIMVNFIGGKNESLSNHRYPDH
jgi:glycosyltransferase involved in cell wall biosynthesis